MKRIYRSRLGACLLTALITAGCGGAAMSFANTQDQTEAAVHHLRNSLPPGYVPPVSLDYNNFNRAQRLYAQPDTIQWCTFSFANPSSPLVTVPVAGKLTSSSVSYLPQDYIDYGDSYDQLRQAFSNDGMYHGNPPPYRYGFTPGGQYVDFSQLPSFCTTALTEFQRQTTKVSITLDPQAQQVTARAESALAAGTKFDKAHGTFTISPQAQAQAQQILTGSGMNGTK